MWTDEIANPWLWGCLGSVAAALWLQHQARKSAVQVTQHQQALADVQEREQQLRKQLVQANDQLTEAGLRQEEAMQREVNFYVKQLSLRDQEAALLHQLNEQLMDAERRDAAWELISRAFIQLFPGWQCTLSIPPYPGGPLRVVAQDALVSAKNRDWQEAPCQWQAGGPSSRPAAAAQRRQLRGKCPPPHGCALAPHEKATICLPVFLPRGVVAVLRLVATVPVSPSRLRQVEALVGDFAAVLRSSLTCLELRQDLLNQQTRDALTGLFNRSYLEETLVRELHRAAREQYRVSLVILDLDGFTHFNEQYGPEAGDDALRLVSMLLQQEIRRSDLIARMKSDEFAVLLARSDASQSARRMEEIQHMLGQNQNLFKSSALEAYPAVVLTASAGIAESDGQESPELFVARAYEALAQARTLGHGAMALSCCGSQSAAGVKLVLESPVI